MFAGASTHDRMASYCRTMSNDHHAAAMPTPTNGSAMRVRHPMPVDRRNRIVVMLTNFFLHLHPVSIKKQGIALSYTWCMGGVTFFLFLVETVTGATHVVRPDHDAAIERDVEDYFARYMTVRKDSLMVDDDEVRDEGRGALVVHATARA